MSLKLPRPAWNKDTLHKYGVWSLGEAVFMDRQLNKVFNEFGAVRFLEIGVAEGATMAGILERCDEIGSPVSYEGVDGLGGKPSFLPDNCKFFEGDSAEQFLYVGDGFNMLLVDACHCVNHTMLDFLNYSPKVVVGGYVIFHDVRDTHWQGNHYQGHGPDVPEFRIYCRGALKKLGLLQGYRADWEFVEEIADGDIQGMYVIRKLKDL